MFDSLASVFNLLLYFQEITTASLTWSIVIMCCSKKKREFSNLCISIFKGTHWPWIEGLGNECTFVCFKVKQNVRRVYVYFGDLFYHILPNNLVPTKPGTRHLLVSPMGLKVEMWQREMWVVQDHVTSLPKASVSFSLKWNCYTEQTWVLSHSHILFFFISMWQLTVGWLPFSVLLSAILFWTLYWP